MTETIREAAQAANVEGAAAYARGDMETAARAWETAVKVLGPDEDDVAPALYENLGLAQYSRGRHRAAAHAFLRALDGNPASREQSLRFLVASFAADGLRHGAARTLAIYEATFGQHPSLLSPKEVAPCCAGEVVRHGA